MPKIQKTEQEWRAESTPDQYRVLRENGTEAPFSGRKDSGIGHECGTEGLYDNLETKLVSFGNVK